MGEIQLKNWTIRPSVGGVCVDGLRVDDASGIYWHSSSIVKRINGRLLATSSGSRYRLLGDLDEIYAKEVSDFLCSLSKQFKRGFPKKWKSLIESTERAKEGKYDGGKQRKVTGMVQAPGNKTPRRQNMADAKQPYEALRSVRPVSCHMTKRAILSIKRIDEETPDLSLHSVTRSMTKNLGKKKMIIMSDSEGSSLEDTLTGTILALRRRNFPIGRTLRKRKRPSDIGAASKKRKVEGHNIRQSLRTDNFPTPAFQNNDVVLHSFSSQGTSLKKWRRMVSTTIEPDILTLEGLLSPPGDASDNPCKVVSRLRTIINPVIVHLDLDEDLEDDVLQKSFLDVTQEDFSKRQSKPRSRTVQPKQHRVPTKQRKSKSQAPSKSQNVRSSTNSPVLALNSETIYGGHNLRPRTVKKDVVPEATAEPRRKLERVGSKSRCGLKEQQASENIINCVNSQQMTVKTLENNAVSGSKAGRKAVTVKSNVVKGPAQQRLENCDQKQPCGDSVDKVKSTSKKDSRKLSRPRSGSRVKPVDLELRTLSAEQIVGFSNDKVRKSVTQSKNLACDDCEDGVAKGSVATESMSTIQQRDGEAGQELVENFQNQVRYDVHASLMAMEAKRFHTAKIHSPKTLEEKEGSNDAVVLELKEKKKSKVVTGNKITSVAQNVGANVSYSRTSVTHAKDSSVANDHSPQIIKFLELNRITSLDSKPMEESESRNSATVSELTEKGEAIDSRKSSNITQGKVSCITQRNGIHVKSYDRQVTETPASFRKMQRNIRSPLGQDKLKIKNKTTQVNPNMDRTDTNGESLERISVPVKNLKPKEKKAVVNKKKTDRKKENEEAVVTEPKEIENGKRSLSTQRLHEQLDVKMNSKIKVIPLLPANSVQVEIEAVEECCLAKCSEENVAVDTKVIPPKRTKKSRKMAEVPVINVKNQPLKSQPKSNKGQKTKASEINASILAKKNDQITNVKLLGGRGTLKRQKELRKLVEKNMHCEDNNDYFSSTPFQSPRARRFVFPQFEDDDDIFAEGDLSKALNCDMTDVTPHGLFRVMDYTANKTPATTTPSTSATPAGIKRRRSEQEAYIHRVKKMLRLGQRKVRNIPKKSQTNYEPAAGASRMPALSLDNDAFDVKEVREQDSEEEDNYFADD